MKPLQFFLEGISSLWNRYLTFMDLSFRNLSKFWVVVFSIEQYRTYRTYSIKTTLQALENSHTKPKFDRDSKIVWKNILHLE